MKRVSPSGGQTGAGGSGAARVQSSVNRVLDDRYLRALSWVVPNARLFLGEGKTIFNAAMCLGAGCDAEGVVGGSGGQRELWQKGLDVLSVAAVVPAAKAVTAVRAVAPQLAALTRLRAALGQWPEYLQAGAKLKALVFSVENGAWTWTKNVRFLDDVIEKGGEFIITTPWSKIRPGSVLINEIAHVMSRGYKFVDDFTRMIPK